MLVLCNDLSEISRKKNIGFQVLSEKTGISVPTLTEISVTSGCPECFVPSVRTALLLALALDVDVDDLFYFAVK